MQNVNPQNNRSATEIANHERYVCKRQCHAVLMPKPTPSISFVPVAHPLFGGKGEFLDLDVAPLQARVNTLSKVGGDALAELSNVGAIDLLRESKRSVDDIWVEAEEVLGDLGSTRVLGVQSSNKDGGLAVRVVVELVVDGALREDSAHELVERTSNFGILASSNESVLEDIAELHATALHDCEEFGCARVNVRSVHAAGLKEAKGGRDAEVGEDRESVEVLGIVSNISTGGA